MSRGYWIRVVIGGSLFVASICWFTWGLYRVLRIGTCASGGPYVSAAPCPDAAGAAIIALTFGIFGVIIGAAILALRGAERPSRANTGLLCFGLGFTLPCAGIVVSLYGPASDGIGSRLGGLIVLIVFLPMGVGPLLAALRRVMAFDEPGPQAVRAPATGVAPRPITVVAPQTRSSAAKPDTADQLEKLAELHRRGQLTDSEFATAKWHLLDEG